MQIKTTVGYTGGSYTTVIPSEVAKLFKIEKGNKITWNVELTPTGATITITPEEK